jgi:hypothetical protein
MLTKNRLKVGKSCHKLIVTISNAMNIKPSVFVALLAL